MSLLQSGSVVFLLVCLTGHVVSVCCFLFLFLTTVVLVESLVEELEGMVITGELLVEGVITGESLVEGVITGESLVEGVITGESLVEGVITGESLVERMITGESLVEGVITGEWLVEGVITGESLGSVEALADLATVREVAALANSDDYRESVCV